MAIVEGFGKCGICLQQIESNPTPSLRHYKGAQMAHKSCWNRQAAYEQTQEYQVEQALAAVETAERRLNSAKYELEVAQIKLKRIMEDVQQG